MPEDNTNVEDVQDDVEQGEAGMDNDAMPVDDEYEPRLGDKLLYSPHIRLRGDQEATTRYTATVCCINSTTVNLSIIDELGRVFPVRNVKFVECGAKMGECELYQLSDLEVATAMPQLEEAYDNDADTGGGLGNDVTAVDASLESTESLVGTTVDSADDGVVEEVTEALMEDEVNEPVETDDDGAVTEPVTEAEFDDAAVNGSELEDSEPKSS